MASIHRMEEGRPLQRRKWDEKGGVLVRWGNKTSIWLALTVSVVIPSPLFGGEELYQYNRSIDQSSAGYMTHAPSG